MSHRLVASIAVVLLTSACSPTPEPSTPQPPTGSATTAPLAPSAVSSPEPVASTTAPAAAAASPFASWTGEPARDTMPPGLSPLTDEEAVEADKKCKPMQDALAAEAKKLKGKPAADAVLEVLAKPSQGQGRRRFSLRRPDP